MYRKIRTGTIMKKRPRQITMAAIPPFETTEEMKTTTTIRIIMIIIPMIIRKINSTQYSEKAHTCGG
jgi:hypothetical protein